MFYGTGGHRTLTQTLTLKHSFGRVRSSRNVHVLVLISNESTQRKSSEHSLYPSGLSEPVVSTSFLLVGTV